MTGRPVDRKVGLSIVEALANSEWKHTHQKLELANMIVNTYGSCPHKKAAMEFLEWAKVNLDNGKPVLYVEAAWCWVCWKVKENSCVSHDSPAPLRPKLVLDPEWFDERGNFRGDKIK